MARISFEGEAVYICRRCRRVSKRFVFALDKDTYHTCCVHCGQIEYEDREFWLDTWPPDTAPDRYGYSGGTAWQSGRTKTS